MAHGHWSASSSAKDPRTNTLRKYYLLPLAAFSARVEITLPSVSKLYEGFESTQSALGSLRGCTMMGSADLVLMYLPSLVRSLSEVAFSEPARSIKLCGRISAGCTNMTRGPYQHRCLDTPSVPTLQLCSSWSLRPESGGHPSCWCHPSTSATLVILPGRASTLPTFDDNTEDTMTPTTPLVPIRARCPPVRVTSLQDLLDTGEICHDFFSEWREPDVWT